MILRYKIGLAGTLSLHDMFIALRSTSCGWEKIVEAHQPGRVVAGKRVYGGGRLSLGRGPMVFL